MKYIRLSKEVIYKVARQATDNKFWPRTKDLRYQRSLYEMKLVEKYVPKEVLRIVKDFSKFLALSIYVYFKTSYEGGKSFKTTMESIAYDEVAWPRMEYIEIENEEFEKFQHFRNLEREVDNERSRFMHNLLKVSDTLNSYKKYVTALPELKPELDHILGLEDKQEETEQKELEKFRESLKE